MSLGLEVAGVALPAYDGNRERAMLLPSVGSRADYVGIYADDEAWHPAIQAICERHRLPVVDLKRQVLGTHVVYRTGRLIVKLFCPLWHGDFAAERAALRGLRGLPVPHIVATGELETWPYLILTVLDGDPAVDVWPTLNHGEKTTIVGQLGRFMRRLHRQPAPAGLSGDWEGFLLERRRDLDDHHKVADHRREWLHRTADSVRHQSGDLVTLNSDLTDDHVLLEKRDGQWRISGIIDFGDAMVGHRLYELTTPILCFASGDPPLARALVESYGERLTPDLAHQILAWCLLHKYIRVSDLLGRMRVDDPESLWDALWGRQLGEHRDWGVV